MKRLVVILAMAMVCSSMMAKATTIEEEIMVSIVVGKETMATVVGIEGVQTILDYYMAKGRRFVITTLPQYVRKIDTLVPSRAKVGDWTYGDLSKEELVFAQLEINPIMLK